jgi:hypothetical protein
MGGVGKTLKAKEHNKYSTHGPQQRLAELAAKPHKITDISLWWQEIIVTYIGIEKRIALGHPQTSI